MSERAIYDFFISAVKCSRPVNTVCDSLSCDSHQFLMWVCGISQTVTKPLQCTFICSSFLKALHGDDYPLSPLKITSPLSFVPQIRYSEPITKKMNKTFKNYILGTGNSYQLRSGNSKCIHLNYWVK